MWNLGSWLVGVGLAHCWALRHQARKRGSVTSALCPVCPGGGWWWGCLLGLACLVVALLCLLLTVGGWWGLVGLLFEICIVDASIFVAIVLLCL